MGGELGQVSMGVRRGLVGRGSARCFHLGLASQVSLLPRQVKRLTQTGTQTWKAHTLNKTLFFRIQPVPSEVPQPQEHPKNQVAYTLWLFENSTQRKQHLPVCEDKTPHNYELLHAYGSHCFLAVLQERVCQEYNLELSSNRVCKCTRVILSYPHECRCPRRPEEGIKSLQLEVQASLCELPCGCWEANSGPSPDQ